jgi:hypothetical protein
MKRLGLFATLPAAMLLAGAALMTTALADDPILTKAPPVSAPPGPPSCDSVPAFFLSTCQLAWYGVRFYGVIDVGGGYQTNGAPFNPQFPQGSSYVVQKMNREPMWTLAPNALSRSSIGIQVNEPIAPGWAFVAILKPGLTLTRCSSPMGRHRLLKIEACRSTSKARIMTPVTQARSTMR